MPPLSIDNYVRVTALVTYETIQLSLLSSFPEISAKEREEKTVEIFNLMARRCGCEIRRLCFEEVDGE
jgi:hypothetical protein